MQSCVGLSSTAGTHMVTATSCPPLLCHAVHTHTLYRVLLFKDHYFFCLTFKTFPPFWLYLYLKLSGFSCWSTFMLCGLYRQGQSHGCLFKHRLKFYASWWCDWKGCKDSDCVCTVSGRIQLRWYCAQRAWGPRVNSQCCQKKHLSCV